MEIDYNFTWHPNQEYTIQLEPVYHGLVGDRYTYQVAAVRVTAKGWELQKLIDICRREGLTITEFQKGRAQ